MLLNRFNVNSPTMGVEIGVPFGGYECSGNGMRKSGTLAVEEYPEVKSIRADFSGLHRPTRGQRVADQKNIKVIVEID